MVRPGPLSSAQSRHLSEAEVPDLPVCQAHRNNNKSYELQRGEPIIVSNTQNQKDHMEFYCHISRMRCNACSSKSAHRQKIHKCMLNINPNTCLDRFVRATLGLCINTQQEKQK